MMSHFRIVTARPHRAGSRPAGAVVGLVVRGLCAIRSGDGWVPIAGPASYGDVNEYLPKFKQVTAEAGRDPLGC